MVTSNYEVNVHLALATSAEHEGDLDTALEFLAEAHRLAKAIDRVTRERVSWRVYWATARFHARNITALPLVKQRSLNLLTAVL